MFSVEWDTAVHPNIVAILNAAKVKEEQSMRIIELNTQSSSQEHQTYSSECLTCRISNLKI